jgi:hypothetical protein
MFNSPPGTSDAMDLAKMLALLELIEPLARDTFRIWRHTRSGLLSFPLDLPAARAHLAASVYVQMALHPHILHVVGHTEADHAATAADVIEACRMARRAIENALGGQPDLTADPRLQQRKAELIAEARITLQAIACLAPGGVQDPWTDAVTLEKAVTEGVLDAPQLKTNPFARGAVATRIIGGACLAVEVSPETGSSGLPVGEAQRLANVIQKRRQS